jgi:hypothetical protein
MDRNTRDLFTVDISSNMASSVNHHTALSFFRYLLGKYTAKQSRTYNSVIIFSHSASPQPNLKILWLPGIPLQQYGI